MVSVPICSIRDVVKLDASDVAVVENHVVYDSFGNIISQTDDTETVGSYFYTGQEFDAETGLYYYNARYYDANTGRFISQDPMSFDAGDMNLYRYVGNNPMTNVDMTGLCSSTYTGVYASSYSGYSSSSSSTYNFSPTTSSNLSIFSTSTSVPYFADSYTPSLLTSSSNPMTSNTYLSSMEDMIARDAYSQQLRMQAYYETQSLRMEYEHSQAVENTIALGSSYREQLMWYGLSNVARGTANAVNGLFNGTAGLLTGGSFEFTGIREWADEQNSYSSLLEEKLGIAGTWQAGVSRAGGALAGEGATWLAMMGTGSVLAKGTQLAMPKLTAKVSGLLGSAYTGHEGYTALAATRGLVVTGSTYLTVSGGVDTVKGIQMIANGDNNGWEKATTGAFHTVMGAKFLQMGLQGSSQALEVSGNRYTAMEFMKNDLGWNWGRRLEAVSGIDLNNSVTVRTLPSNTNAIQYVRTGKPIGSWFTQPGTSATNVGIAPYFRRPQSFINSGSLRALESTAKGVFDYWTVPGFDIKTIGGGTQWITNPSNFVPAP